MCTSQRQLPSRGGEAPVGLKLLRVRPRCHTLQPLFVETSAQYSLSGKAPPPQPSGALRDLLAALRSAHVCWCLWLECITKEPISSSDNNQIFLSSQHAPAANSGIESCMASEERAIKDAFINVYSRFIWWFSRICQGSRLWFSLDIPAILGGVSCEKEAPVFDFCDRIIAYSTPSNVELGFKTHVSLRSGLRFGGNGSLWLRRGRHFSRLCQERLPDRAELISVGGLFMVWFPSPLIFCPK